MIDLKGERMSTMVEDLLEPVAYPDKPGKVTLAQTHISNVFIGDEFVYKIKKPVNFGFLDFSTLELREKYCREEVELNNRFSEGVYLGVYPVTFDGTRHRIDGDGKVVEYAVKMKRLPDENLMKVRLAGGELTETDITRIAKTIADIHSRSKGSEKINEFGKLEAVRFNVDECFEQTEEFIGNSITKKQYDSLKSWTENFYAENGKLFDDRINEGRIKDCHGDLHMEHVCLTDPIIIFDCIEFNERFRFSDTASDIAFLLMDLEYNGGKDFAKLLKNEYLKFAGEKDISGLINFYKVYRAYVRGKVTSFMLNDPAVPDEKKDKARITAQKYFELAYSYTI